MVRSTAMQKPRQTSRGERRLCTDRRATRQAAMTEMREAQATTEQEEVLDEELRAGNEELKTLNKEFQVTIEELQTTNEDLDARTIGLRQLATALDAQRDTAEVARALLAAILVSIDEAVLVVERGGLIILTNAAYDRRFGSAAPEIKYETVRGESLAPEDHPVKRAAWDAPFTMQFSTRTPDGVRHYFCARGQPLQDGAGSRGVIAIRDVTADHLQRQTLDQFLALASHELRTPLTTIKGYLELLLDRYLPADAFPDVRRCGTVALHQAEIMQVLVKDLVDVTRLQTGKLTLTYADVDLVVLLRAIIASAQGFARTRVVRLDAPMETLMVWGDAVRLEQVFLNLVTNASRHSPAAAEITLQLRQVDGTAQVQVIDHGTGIAAADLPHLFSAFYQAPQAQHSSREGLGLGLYISRELVSLHKGTIAVTTAEGAGTTITVQLPLVRK